MRERMITLHRKGVKRWQSHAERGDAVAAGMNAAGHSGVVFGEHADAIRVRIRVRVKVKRY